ncbi:hypothetical protein EK21DRAFT_86439 [Setomelanomma holmii]|uniref:Uncharacterized protein n=1 Tax=Setomelanomma holmii TaxID=210430 RepID=A0A9P4HGV3_9PLEO|nr:hypothetical protein EK21DRAFT_86439 [Setomelanomma holmii]
MPASTSHNSTTDDSIVRSSLSAVFTDNSPWTCDKATGDIFAVGELLTNSERNLVILASRHPENFKGDAVPKGLPPLTGWERELVKAAKKFSIDFKNIADFYPKHCPPPPQVQKKKSKSQIEVDNDMSGPKRQPLPAIPIDRAPWGLKPRSEEIFVSGKPLPFFERRLVFLAPAYPERFTEAGQFRAKGEPTLTGWELELVRAARKFPIEHGDVSNEQKRYSEVDRQVPSEGLREAIEQVRRRGEKVGESGGVGMASPHIPSATKTKPDSNAPWNRKAPQHPASYARPRPGEPFWQFKKRVLSNAHAYYGHRYPRTKHYDLITSAVTPTRTLASTLWRATLIVYPEPGRREWQVLYRSNVCPTVEDAAFEIKFWIEEDMSGVLDGMRNGEVWVVDKNNRKKKRKDDEGGKMDGVEMGKENEKKEDETTKEKEATKAKEKLMALDVSELGSDPKDEAAVENDATKPTTSDLKRKSHGTDDDEEERKKAYRIGEEERVFVGDVTPASAGTLIAKKKLDYLDQIAPASMGALTGEEDRSVHQSVYGGD